MSDNAHYVAYGNYVAFRLAISFPFGKSKRMKTKNPSRMSPQTRAAVAAILDADAGLSPAHRLAILTACDKPPEAATVAPGPEMPARDAARILGKSLSTILRWMDSGKLQGRKIGARLTVVSCASVEAIRARLASR